MTDTPLAATVSMLVWLVPAGLFVTAPLLLQALAGRSALPLAGVLVLGLPTALLCFVLIGRVPELKALDEDLRRLAADRMQTKDLEPLLQQSRAVLDNCPECDRVRSTYADLLMLQERFGMAEEQYLILTENAPEDADLLIRRAQNMYLMAQSDGVNGPALLERAQGLAQRALAERPGDIALLRLLARLAENLGQVKKALGFLNQAFELTSRNSTADTISLLAEMGRLQRLLHPESDYVLTVGLNCRLPPQHPDPLLLIRVYPETGPGIPLAGYRQILDRCPLEVELDSDSAPLPGFDLAAARRRGEKLRLVAEIHSSGSAEISAGTLLLSAEAAFIAESDGDRGRIEVTFDQ